MEEPAVRETILQAAARLRMLDAEGRLHRLDSLTLLDLVMELEAMLGISIPLEIVTAESFRTVESIALALAPLTA